MLNHVFFAIQAANDTVSRSSFNLNVGLAAGLGVLISLIVGLILGWYFAMRLFKKQMRENPPISEKQIRAMYAQMGRKPSERQVRQIMNQFKQSGG